MQANSVYYNQLAEQGFVHLPGFFSSQQINSVLTDIKTAFARQIQAACNYLPEVNDTLAIEAGMRALFKHDLNRFIQTGKTVQHLIGLHQMALQPSVTQLLQQLGLAEPAICTRPVVFFNHPELASNPEYHTTPAHQDWRSMQGSLNALVVWVPLVDIDVNLGPIEVVPGSHRLGLLPSQADDWYRKLDVSIKDADFLSVPVKAGDLVCFSAFLIHRSGRHQSQKVRWSCHFRYNDLAESTFIQRGYPNPYVYKPQQDLVTPDFPEHSQVTALFTSLNQGVY